MQGKAEIRDANVVETSGLVMGQDGSHFLADLAGAAEGFFGAVACVLDGRQAPVGAVQQLPPAPGPLLCQDRVSADHQAFSREGGIRDFCQIHLLEQRRMESALLDQWTDGRPAQSRDPVQMVGGEIRLEAGPIGGSCDPPRKSQTGGRTAL